MASLLQSAVKIEEDLFADENDAYEHTAASLESLRTEKLPPLPDTQDRKRFVGCLASVLAFLNNQAWCTGSQRHHAIYEQLLADSAVLLQLEPTQSRCFIPMLRSSSSILAPLPRGTDYQTVIRHIPFLDSFLMELASGAGLRCLCLLLTQHLLTSKDGYDSRVRHALRVLGVVVLYHDNPECCPERQFEALEQAIAWKLILLSNPHNQQQQEQIHHHRSSLTNNPAPHPARSRILRGLKIGGTAVAAGTLFAISGGIAAPAIVSALAGTALASVAALSTTAAATAVFGVTGGSLVAYKMQRRTVGLTEFEFDRHTATYELSSTICLSGWLEQDCDFERPWGVKVQLEDAVERLERFYQVVRPCHVEKAKQIVQSFRGNESLLYSELWKTYGADPNNLYPLGPRPALSPDDREVVDGLFHELGLGTVEETPPPQPSPLERLQKSDEIAMSFDVTAAPSEDDISNSNSEESTSSNENSKKPPKHLKTVWDYQNRYGGELYTVRWESKLLVELCDSVVDLAADLVSGATTQILKHTALATLVAAVALPVALTSAANMIDGTWTLVIERADEAGKELAQSLLYSTAGHRPVALVGFSFGARVIYTCLKELARYQEEWEEYHQLGVGEKVKRRMRRRKNPDGDDTDWATMREPASIVGDVCYR